MYGRKSYDNLIRAIADASNLDFHYVEKQFNEMIEDVIDEKLKDIKNEIELLKKTLTASILGEK